MKYTVGKKTDTGALTLVKIWKGESLEKAAEVNGCEIVDPNMLYDSKKEAHKGLRALMRLRGGQEDAQHYDPSGDRLLTDVGKVHPGDGHVVQVSVKDQGAGPQVLIQRFRAVAGSRYGIGGLGRMAPGAARRVAQLLLKAAEIAEGHQASQTEATS